MAANHHFMWIFLILAVLPCSRGLDVSIPQEEYEAASGEDVVLTCNFAPANPNAEVVALIWKAIPHVEGDALVPLATYYPNKPIDIGPQYEGRAFLEADMARKTSTLRLSKVTIQDSRHYQCSVLVPNDDEGKTAATTSVLVLVPPSPPICKIEGQPYYGHNINLTCKSEEGSPTPTPKWTTTFTVENQPRRLPPKAHESPLGVLHLFNVSRDTSGFFICESKNRIGFESCNFTLSVTPGSMNFGSTALIVVGVLAGVIVIAIVIFCCWRRRRGKKVVEGAPEDVYFDENAPETGEEYEDKPSREAKKPQSMELKAAPQNYVADRKVVPKFEDDQHSDNSGGDSDGASRRYQNEQREGYRGSRDRLEEKQNHYSGSRDRLDERPNRYGGSRDRLDEGRDTYRGSRDRLDEGRDTYRGSRDRLDEGRDTYRGSRDRLDDSRDTYRGGRDRHDDYRDHHRGSRDRLDDRSDHYGGSSRSDHYGGGGGGGSGGGSGGYSSRGGYDYNDD